MCMNDESSIMLQHSAPTYDGNSQNKDTLTFDIIKINEFVLLMSFTGVVLKQIKLGSNGEHSLYIRFIFRKIYIYARFGISI